MESVASVPAQSPDIDRERNNHFRQTREGGIVSLSSNKTQLSAITRELLLHWKETKEVWRDAKSAEFERQYLEELFDGVDTAVGVMDQLEKILNKLRSDCE